VSLLDLLPAELLGLPEPWRATHDFQRAQATESLPIEPPVIDIGLDALARVLRASSRLSGPDALPLPEEAREAYGFAMLGLSKRITILDELTPQPFEEWLASALGRTPHALETLALVQAWIYSVCAGISRTALMWLTTHARQIPREQRKRLVAIAGELVWRGTTRSSYWPWWKTKVRRLSSATSQGDIGNGPRHARTSIHKHSGARGDRWFELDVAVHRRPDRTERSYLVTATGAP
jgi:hypothetical protein